MSALWRIRQHSCIDAAGRVVDVRTEKGIGHPDVVAWRVRWDAPGRPGRSRTFTKAAYPTASAAHAAALDFVDELRAAARDDQPADERGRPASRTATPETAEAVAAPAADARLTLEALGQAWIAAAGGAPKTVQQHEQSLKFALDHLPPGIIADDVSSTQIQELLQLRRFTPGTKASKLVRMGVLDPTDDRARMCSFRTETLFVQDLRNIFTFGIDMKPAAVYGHRMQTIKARSKKSALKDPSAEYTFTPAQVTGIARLVEDVVLRFLIIIRAITALRTGEAASVTIDDVDVIHRCITVRATEGDAARRLTPDGSTRSRNHLKQRSVDDERVVDYPATPAMDAIVATLIDEARRRHRAREERLVELIARYRAETGKEHLARQRAVELRAHRSSAPRLFTMPDGRPFNVSDFDQDVWKPALRRFFPIDDPTHEDYTPQREARFYDLRSSAIEFWIEELDMDESQAAHKAGHSVHVQRLHYRRARAKPKRPEKLEEASAAFELDEQTED
jgi:integrase